MAPARDTLFFDGACGMCTRSTRILRTLDWLGRLEFRDFTQLPDEDLPVKREVAMQGLPMLTRRGRVLVGFPSMRRALAQTPAGCLPALLLYVPGLSHIGSAVYRRVALNRGRSTACATAPTEPGG